MLGAIGVAWAQTLFSERFPSEWTYAQGLLFIVVVGFFPAGLAGLGALVKRWRARKPKPPPEREPGRRPDRTPRRWERRHDHVAKWNPSPAATSAWAPSTSKSAV